MVNKRAQAAMEFLMTYGWAILVVLVAIGALAYFGVLSPDNFLPERCTGTAGLDCLDKASIDVAAGTVTVALKNNIGYPIVVHALPLPTSALDTDLCGAAGAATPTNISFTWENGTVQDENVLVPNNRGFNVQVTCTAMNAGRLKGDVLFVYTNDETGLNHTAKTSVTGRG